MPLDQVAAGDAPLVAAGEVVPVDGTLMSGGAVLDESALTGEALPVEHVQGDTVRSGTVNAAGPFDLRAAATAADSTYAGIVRLVEQAERSQAPFVRLADRYATWFLPLTLAVAGVAWLRATRPGRWRCWWWPRRARLSWRHRSPWFRAYRQRPGAVWW